MEEWYKKSTPYKYYLILDGDKDCKLNNNTFIEHDCKDPINEYNIEDLDLLRSDSDKCGGWVYPNSDGSIIIPHYTPDIIITSPLTNWWFYPTEPTLDSFYDSITQDQVDNHFKTIRHFFNLGKWAGSFKKYNNFEEYKIDSMKRFYKYCPRKLNEIEQKSKNEDIATLDNEQTNTKIDELRAESDVAHEAENSTANKLIGAAGIGATGVGAMQLMSGMAEKSADEDAENQMKAYMATFRCNYGGLSHKGGEVGIELPAGDLSALKQEYLTLAADLKIRKESLDMQPGIESEGILDAATAGLYIAIYMYAQKNRKKTQCYIPTARTFLKNTV